MNMIVLCSIDFTTQKVQKMAILKQRCGSILLVLGLAQLAMSADPPFPESMVTLLAQPSVFFVRATADIELTYPETVSVNLDALKNDLANLQDAGVVNRSVADRYFDLLVKNPNKYLQASKEETTERRLNVDAWSGSAFAISREGILLTNAHVVCTGPDRPITEDNVGVLNEAIGKNTLAMTKVLGQPTLTDERRFQTLNVLYSYYAARSRVATKFRAARIVLDYKVDLQKSFAALKAQGIDEALRVTREEITVPAEVLDVGEWLPGKDVAVLRAKFGPNEQLDRFVCLSLGNVNDVLPQASVHSLGFPGVAFSKEDMDPEAQFKVSSYSGQISQTKRMRTNGGWDIFEMTAVINHGDSGGPVLDRNGKVIAINVGIAKVTDEPSVFRLAIPVNVAKDMLAKLGIKPDPGKLSAHWERGLRLYSESKYEESFQEIQAAIVLQKGKNFLENREASWYLRDMAGRCLQKLGKIPGGN